MGTRLELHGELLTIVDRAYFQAPSNINMTYPCVVYNKAPAQKLNADNTTHRNTQQYRLTVIDRNPDSTIADELVEHFQYCSITNYFVVDNLNHTILTLYY